MRRTLPDSFSCKPSLELVQKLIEDQLLTPPICMIVPDANSRLRHDEIHCIIKPNKLPSYSFVDLCRYQKSSAESTIYVVVASPELCFLQASETLKIYDAIKFGYELCSDFFYCKNEKYGLSYHPSITSRQKISDFLSRAEKMKGIPMARRSLQYVHNHARSPMEILQAMVVSLPISYGGFAVKGFELNGHAELSTDGKRILGGSSCICDMIWEKQKVVLEYDSNQVHLDSYRHAKDKNRISALGASGYKVFTLTTNDIRSPSKVENILFALRNELGLKKETRQFQKFRFRRGELLNWVIDQMNRDLI